jgi:2-oxoglutarate dehydrogenase E2 component (dihydrolipoamide succinyltransferase)
MQTDIRVPEAGESITQVELARWLVADGDYVEKDQEIAEIDSDKATLTINAPESGVIRLALEEGSTTEPGKVIGRIDTSAERPEGGHASSGEAGTEAEAPSDEKQDGGAGKKEEPAAEAPAGEENAGEVTFSPQASRLLEEMGLEAGELAMNPEGKRLTKKDILAAISARFHEQEGGRAQKDGAGKRGKDGETAFRGSWGGKREEERQKMSTLRRKVAERLVAVKNETAMLTTFNEADMSAILDLRRTYQAAFQKQYGIKLGFMSFFVKAVAESIPAFPQVNGRIEGDHIVIPSYADIGIAVSTPKGLMVPVIRNAEAMSIPELEQRIHELAEKARNNKIGLDELSGGTLSITNGGVFGSMLSTPIINPPQSAILGMHNILERPVARDGKVEIRPMMYLALSYDHRIIDGRESVGFLVRVKEMIENPARMLLGGDDPAARLTGL